MLHKERKKVCAHLSKELREKYGRRSFSVRKGDKVKIMIGKNKGKEGKVVYVSRKGYLNIENIKLKKIDGTEVYLNIDASNVMITELDLNDNKRLKALKRVS